MPKKCIINNCTTTSRTQKYHFPTRGLQRKLWTDAVRPHIRIEDQRQKRLGKENWNPSSSDIVCPKHFVSGQKSSLPGHDGFVPTIFSIVTAKSSATQTNGSPVIQPPPVLPPRPFKEQQLHQQQQPQPFHHQHHQQQHHPQLLISTTTSVIASVGASKEINLSQKEKECDHITKAPCQTGASLPGGSPLLQQQASPPPHIPSRDSVHPYSVPSQLPQYFHEPTPITPHPTPQHRGRVFSHPTVPPPPPLTSNPIAPHTPLPQPMPFDEPTPAEPAPGEPARFNSYPSTRGRPRVHNNANWIASKQTPTVDDHDYLPSMFKISDTPLSELEELSKKCQEMEEDLNEMRSRSINLESCKSDKDMNYYTGFPNYATFFALFSYLEEKASVMNMWRGSQTSSNPSFSTNKPGCNSKLSLEECYFLTLVRLRTGMSVEQLARAFGISSSHASRIFISWVNLLYIELKDICELPSKNVTDENQSKSFTVFDDLRIVLDCTELFIQTPKNLSAKKQTFSSYKHHNTYKFLVGLSPQCGLTYVSSMWGGRASDKKITEASGDLIVNMEEGGGVILTDRGFDNIFSSSELEVMMPAFKGRDRVQFSANEVTKLAKISNVRVHVERIIGRIKNFHILSGNLRLSMKDTTEQIFTVCAYLTNFQAPILQDHDIHM